MPTPETSEHPSVQHSASTAFLALIAKEGWAGASLEKLAHEINFSPAELLRQHGDRWDLLRAFGRSIDVEMLAQADAQGGSQAVRDRLFTLIMARFDALSPHKAAIRNLLKAARQDPKLACFFLAALPRAIELIANAAGISTSHWLGLAKSKALMALYLDVVRVWLKDESEDMAKTMSALDKRLAQAENLASRLPKAA
jgi:ubiquinone biosynthesis protein COQ9